MKSTTDIHWNERALSVKDDIEVKIMDIFQRNLEYAEIQKWLRPDMQVLEVGCGNGFSTEVFAAHAKTVDAFDYAEAMVERAKERVKSGKVHFFHDNILQPKSISKTYDAVICVRVLINLRNLDEQKTAIANMSRFVKPGGYLILAEGYTEGFDALTEIRKKVGLPPVAPAKINFYAKRNQLDDAFAAYTLEDEFHLGMYDYLTRVFYPLVVGPENAKHNTEFSEKAAALAAVFNPPDMKRFSRLQGLLLKKKA